MTAQFHDDLNTIKKRFLDNLFNNWQLPPVLYHYTSILGLKGILDSNKIYATHYHYMNDGKEIQFGDELAVNELENRISKESNPGIVGTFEECIGKDYGGPLSVLKAFDNDYYIVSFSEDGDLLDQWRAYGDDGQGYSLGISPGGLAAKKAGAIITDHQSLAFIKVEYDEVHQKKLINQVIEDLFPVLVKALIDAPSDFERQIIQRKAAMHLGNLLTQLSLFFKHPTFRNEKEWRVVQSRWGRNVRIDMSSKAHMGVEYRPSKGILIPFLTLNFQSMAFENLLPLEQIYIGPKHKTREIQVKQSLHMQLISSGYGEHKIMPALTVSGVPYQ